MSELRGIGIDNLLGEPSISLSPSSSSSSRQAQIGMGISFTTAQHTIG
jgi:hypothetical protein